MHPPLQQAVNVLQCIKSSNLNISPMNSHVFLTYICWYVFIYTKTPSSLNTAEGLKIGDQVRRGLECQGAVTSGQSTLNYKLVRLCFQIVFEQILEFSKQGESSSVSFSSFSFLIHHSHNVWADLANAAAMLKIPPSVLLGLAWGQTWACAYKCPLCSTVEMSNK